MDTMQGIDVKVNLMGEAPFTALNVRTVREALAQYADHSQTPFDQLTKMNIRVGHNPAGLDQVLQKGEYITLGRRIEGGEIIS